MDWTGPAVVGLRRRDLVCVVGLPVDREWWWWVQRTFTRRLARRGRGTRLHRPEQHARELVVRGAEHLHRHQGTLRSRRSVHLSEAARGCR